MNNAISNVLKDFSSFIFRNETRNSYVKDSVGSWSNLFATTPYRSWQHDYLANNWTLNYTHEHRHEIRKVPFMQVLWDKQKCPAK